MMLLKLTLFTLLMAALDFHVSGEKEVTCTSRNRTCPTIVTCDGGTAVLNCGHRRIRIIRAFYGRLDSTTCAAGRPANQICNRHCYLPSAQYIVSSRCNGRCYCHVPVQSCVLPDPCYGTYKYLSISYYCA
ncbi:L-rhamnose-binding lectin CSL2-like [Tachysurus fulvidraco]|uniref:L-rhamnose-binding lectin CSL2-like n=1 Tax=Tachysurus fulvidraco TaxID=1234273 RepID=UPI001FF0780A|nr:L-rhamnose-binding lectin CSL2-like [Tachysurus fulvidraco]